MSDTIPPIRSGKKKTAAKTALKATLAAAAGAALLTETAAAQDAPQLYDISQIDGVSASRLLADGRLEVTMEDGRQLILEPGQFVQQNGQFLVTEAGAEAFTDGSGNLLLIGGAVAAVGAIAAVAFSDGDDDEAPVVQPPAPEANVPTAGDDVLNGDAADNTIDGLAGNDTINGLGGNDTLIGSGGNDTLDGGAGDDILRGGGGADALDGGEGSDTASFSDIGQAVTVDLAAGTADYESASDTLANIENVEGSAQDDVIVGDANANVLDGGDGNDTLRGGAGNDTLTGGAGDDILAGGGGADMIDGGEGVDTNSFEGIGVGVTATLNADGTGTADYGMVSETFSGIENLTGSDNDDVLIASGAAANVISGGAGDDVIAGGGGVDVLDGGEGNDTNSFEGIGVGVTANLGDGTASYGMVDETFTNFENLRGSSNDDSLRGDGNANVLEGEDGDDTIIWSGGEDTLDGGAGIDTLDYQTSSVGVDIQLSAGTATRTLMDGTVEVDTISNFENAIGSEFDDTLRGNGLDNVLEGGAGDDTLVWSGGEDVLDGGEGFDTADYTTSAVPVIVDLDENGNGTVTREVGFSVEVVDAEVADDAAFVQAAVDGNLYFNVHTEEFGGGEIRGQLSVTTDETVDGVRTITLDASLDAAQEPNDASDSEATGEGQVVITVDADGVATYSSTLDISGISPSELITLGNGALSAIHLHNAPAGTNGPVLQDIIVDAGGDVEGNNGFEVDVDMAEVAMDAAFVEAADAGNLYFNIHTADFPGGEIRGQLDTVVSDETVDGVRTLVLSAELDASQEPNDASDSDATGEATVTIVIDAEGNATYSSSLSIDGINVDDLITLGNGALSAIHLHNAPAGTNGPVLQDVTVDAGGTTTDFSVLVETDVIAETVEVDTLTSIEQVILSENNDITNPAAGDQSFDGGAGDDVLFGGAGNDTLSGGAGDDILAGGGGTDIIDGGEGNDTNSFAGIGRGVTATLNADGTGTAEYGPVTETFTGIENLIGSDNDDVLIANGAAANVINGGAGDDIIGGGGGVDSLSGGEGNDTLTFQGIGRNVDANLGNGTALYVAPNGTTIEETFDGFENLEGFVGNDRLTGDEGDNVLDGGAGNDTLVGGAGNDTLIGGAGDDLLRAGPGQDSVDGGEGIDTIDVSDIPLDVEINLAEGTASYGMVNEEVLNVENIIGSEGDDTLIGDEGDNNIAGNAGDDYIEGGAGNDVLRGDAIGDGEAIQITIENTLPEGGTFLTPVWFGFNDGAETGFSTYVRGEEASTGLERLAEDGSVAALANEFSQATGDRGVDATIFGLGAGAPGPIDPGETASFIINVDPADVGEGNFVWATMVIPSNDAFLSSPGNPLADPIFSSDGQFLGPIEILRFGSDVLDAGTEANTELDAAFLNQTAPNTGEDEGGVVRLHEGFNGSEANPDGTPINILGGVTAAGATIDPEIGDFSFNNGQQLLVRILIDRAVIEGNDTIDGGAGDDLIDGGFGDDVLIGGTGNDTLIGGAGDDVLRGGAGQDSLDGGEGNDTADHSDIGVGVTVDLGAGTATYGMVSETLTSIENVIGTAQDDTIRGNGEVNVIEAGDGDDTIIWTGGEDTYDGGEGFDTVDYTTSSVPVVVQLDADGNGTATRELGFSVEVTDAEVADDAGFVQAAVDGNLYFNVHTEEFGGGEIRGQLSVSTDETVDGVRTITLDASLDGAQEPNDASDSEATGEGQVIITVDAMGVVTYSSTLDISGISPSELVSVGGGALSAIHLHNAPAGTNGPVLQDIIQDAGGDVNGMALSPEADTGDGDVFVEVIEVDTLVSIEQVIGQDGMPITTAPTLSKLSVEDDVAFATEAANDSSDAASPYDYADAFIAEYEDEFEAFDSAQGPDNYDTFEVA